MKVETPARPSGGPSEVRSYFQKVELWVGGKPVEELCHQE